MIAKSRKPPMTAGPRPTFAFEQSLEGTQDAVRNALTYFVDQLVMLDLDEGDLATVELVLAEALNNIVEHAFADQTEPGFIRIRCVCQSGDLHLRITDFGRAMPDIKIPDGNMAAFGPETADLPEGGFGWAMIHALTEDISYVRSGPMNALTLRIGLRNG